MADPKTGNRSGPGAPQTAIRGALSVSVINVMSRLVGYATHVVITAFIGLSARLDAYYVAMTILSVCVLALGDVFDTLGIPRLVQALRQEGEERFRRLAGSIFVFACLLSGTLCLLLFLAAPLAPGIAPGFDAGMQGLVRRNLYLLLPAGLLYLPYHAMGSFLRARRRFTEFYVGDLIAATTMLAVIYAGRRHPDVLPAAFSLSYVVVFAYVLVAGRRNVRLARPLGGADIRETVRGFFFLLPLYLVAYLFPLVDRAFASYLPTGSVSALSYGLLVAMIPSSILALGNIFVTPLSETDDRDRLMKDIANGVLIISVPLVLFSVVHARPIIRVAFERGAFTPDSTRTAGDTLAFFALAIPLNFFWPILYRLLQILHRFRAVGLMAAGSLLLNVALNALFLRMGLGVKGLALATVICSYALASGAVSLLAKEGIRPLGREALPVFLSVAAISGVALGAALLVPLEPHPTAGMLARGIVYLGVTLLLLFKVREPHITAFRSNVLRDILPTGTGRGAP